MFKLFQPGPYNPDTVVIIDGLNKAAEFSTVAAALTQYKVTGYGDPDLLGQDVYIVEPTIPVGPIAVSDLPLK